MNVVESEWGEFSRAAKIAWLRHFEGRRRMAQRSPDGNFVQLTKLYRDYVPANEQGGEASLWVNKEVKVWVGLDGLRRCYLERHEDDGHTEIVGDHWSMTVKETLDEIMGA